MTKRNGSNRLLGIFRGDWIVVCCLVTCSGSEDPREAASERNGAQNLSVSSTVPASTTSIEFGRTQWGTDYATRPDAPAGGSLFSVWTKIPDPGSSYPWSRGDMDVYLLIGANWYFRGTVGNSGANSSTDARYNANTMLFGNNGNLGNDGGTWASDYSYYESGWGNPEAPYRDWVWVAWQIIVNSDSFTIRQWLKFGVNGAVLAAGESTPTFAAVRILLVQSGWTQAAANAWTPTDAKSFQVGSGNGYLSYARMMARNTLPTLAELETMARNSVADTSAWADYPLAWANGVANLLDRSGKGRNLSLAKGGTLYQGPAGPSLATGGSTSTGGTTSTAGNTSTGGSAVTGGVTSTGGARATGGIASTGGTAATGGVTTTGGAVSTGGSSSTAPSPSTSIEFGRTQWGTDYATRQDAPAGGALFSIWTKIPDPGSSYPWSRGNMDVYLLIGANWYFRGIVGNSGANSSTDARYNANTMLFGNNGKVGNDGGTWASDYSYYESGWGHPEAPYRDWVWVAWQIIVNSDSFTIRQWLKFGVNGAVFAAGESTPTFAAVRILLVQNGWTQAAANAWTPTDAKSFQVGSGNGYLTRARMMARNTLPTLAELDAMARNSVADTSAWADYPLAWANGVANLLDRSGKGRNLSLAKGGTLYQGPAGPSL